VGYRKLSPQALLRVVNSCGAREEIMNASLSALRHLTSRHPSAEMAQNAVCAHNGIPLLVSLIQPQNRWRVCKPLVGLIRNLALSPSNLAPLRDHGCIPKLWHIVNRAYQDGQKRTVPNGPAGFIVSLCTHVCTCLLVKIIKYAFVCVGKDHPICMCVLVKIIQYACMCW